MRELQKHTKRVGQSRRDFLKTSAAAISVTFLPVSAMAKKIPGGPVSVEGVGPSAPAGVATRRIEGFEKVTGAKIFARDFNAGDLNNWPETQWHAMFVRATTTTQKFIGLDLSLLPKEAAPSRVIYGDQVHESIRAPIRNPARDHEMDLKMIAALSPETADDSDNSFDHPDGLLFDLVVKRGVMPDFLGQAVALLMFSSSASWRRAHKLLQFRDDDFQLYAGEPVPGPGLTEVLSPTTWFVKAETPDGLFSSATVSSDAYRKVAPVEASKIAETLRGDPSLITHKFTSSMQAMDPMFMEPEAGLVWYDGSGETLNILLGTQSPDGDIDDLKTMFAAADSPLKVQNIVMTPCFPGGGFGGRDRSPFTYMLALCAAHSDGMPVKLEYDRFEQFRVGLKRHGGDLAGLVAMTPEKELHTIKMNMNFDGGGRKNLSPYVANLAAICAGGSYRVPFADIYAQAIHSENVSGGSQRGFGGPQAFFALETALDQIASEQGWDPFDLRRANLAKEGDTTVVGGPIDQSLRLNDLLTMAEENPVWRDREATRAAFAETPDQRYGVGLAMSMQAYGTSGDGVVGAVHISREGRYKVQTDAVDMGNGSATTLGVVIGRILGSNAESVEVGDYQLFAQTGLTTKSASGKKPDWDDPKWTAKKVGSSSSCLTGLHQVHVVEQAADALFAASILPAASMSWQIGILTSDDVEWVGGALRLKAGGKPDLPISALAGAIYAHGLPTGALGHGFFQADWVRADYVLARVRRRLALDSVTLYHGGDTSAPTPVSRHATQPPPAAAGKYRRSVWAPCVNLIGLTVNTGTGQVQVLKSVSVLNAGRVHVPQLVSGQSEGGIAMTIGYTLLEDMPAGMAGPANGTWNLNQYHVPRLADVPITRGRGLTDPVQELLLLDPLPNETHVGRGIAEAVMCSVAPAISNAIHDAVGARLTDLPITPQKVLEGMKS